MKHWKKYVEAKKLIEENKRYSLEEAVALAKKVSYTKFQATIEVHIKTSADPKYNDQMIRGTVVLPAWTWKKVKVAAFVSDDLIEEAKKAWAEIAWNTEILKNIENWNIDFDVLITTQDMMRDLAKVAKALWPKGLMPSPKAWTVTNDIKATIDEIKKWRIEYKLDKTWNLHIPVGKAEFEDSKLLENINAILKSLEETRPSWVKWKIIKKMVVAPTMWPWVTVEI